MIRRLQPAAFAVLLASLAPGQGDFCSDGTPITGTGVFPFDSTTNVTSGFTGGSGDCSIFPADNDVFWDWTAPATDTYQFAAQGLSYDGLLYIHAGDDCSALCLEASLNECLDGPAIRLDVVQGAVYLIQIGGWTSGPTSGTGNLTVDLVPPAPANDDCSTATAISGLGSFAFDATGAASSTFNGGDPVSCPPTYYGGPVYRDVFFAWTATDAGDTRFDDCGSTTSNLVNVHLGSDCSATCIEQGFDNLDCPNSSGRVLVPDVAIGERYLIQAGSWGPSICDGVGVLNISLVPPASGGEGTCDEPLTFVGEGALDWDNSVASTTGFDGGNPVTCMSPANPDGSALGQIHGDLFYLWICNCPGDYRFEVSATIDTRISLHSGTDCQATCLASDGVVGGMPGVAFVDVLGLSCGDTVLIQLGSYDASSPGSGTLEVLRLGAPCVPGACGAEITCTPSNPHYLGGGATLVTSEVGAATPSGLRLECTRGPAGEFAFFLVAPSATQATPAFAGILCLDAPIGRYNALVASNQQNVGLISVGQFDASGRLRNLFGNATSSDTGEHGFDVPLELPFTPPGQMILPGESWSFQCWFRDQDGMLPNPGSTANFSDVATVTF